MNNVGDVYRIAILVSPRIFSESDVVHGNLKHKIEDGTVLVSLPARLYRGDEQRSSTKSTGVRKKTV